MTICPSKIIKSKPYILTEIGIPNFLFRINGGISIPPVLAPQRITNPIAVPIINPAKITHNNVSLLIISFLKTP